MKVFVTGATGFLGSHLVDLLLREGHEVICLVRPSSNLRWLEKKPVQLVEGDLSLRTPAVVKALKNSDWFFHLAGLIQSSHREEYFRVNEEGTRSCLEACLTHAPGLKRFVLVSSVAAAGLPSQDRAMDETSIPAPFDVYGESKLAGEKAALSYRDKLPLVILRPPAIYGVRDRLTFPIFKSAAKGFCFVPAGKERQISLIHVEDIAAACLWAARSDKAVGEIFFVTDGERHTWQSFGKTLCQVLDRKVVRVPVSKTVFRGVVALEGLWALLMHQTPRLRKGYVRQFFGSWNISSDKIRKAGFVPRIDLIPGIRKTVDGYLSLGWI